MLSVAEAQAQLQDSLHKQVPELQLQEQFQHELIASILASQMGALKLQQWRQRQQQQQQQESESRLVDAEVTVEHTADLRSCRPKMQQLQQQLKEQHETAAVRIAKAEQKAKGFQAEMQQLR